MESNGEKIMKALVLYHSDSGNTESMAKAVAEGLKAAGCEVDAWNTKQGKFNVKDYAMYDCVAVGSPDYFSYVAGPIKSFMDEWYFVRNNKGMANKPYALFYNHGGGGAVKGSMEGLIKYLGTQVGKSVGTEGKPDAKTLEACRELGKKLADAVK